MKLDFSPISWAGEPAAGPYVVEADLAFGASPTLTYRQFNHKGTLVASGTKPFDPDRAELWRVSPTLALGVLPAKPAWFDFLTTYQTEGTAGMAPASAPIPGRNLTVVGATIDGTAERFVTGAVWADADGTVHDSLGNVVPAAPFEFNDAPTTLYYDRALDTIGLRSVSMGASTWLSAVPPETALSGGVGDRTARAFLAGMLPEGAHDVTVVPGSGAAASLTPQVQSVRNAVLYLVEGPATDLGTFVASLSWTDAAGVRHTVDPNKR